MILGICCLIHPHGFWQVISNSHLGQNAQSFYLFPQINMQLHSHHTYPLGSTPLGLKFKCQTLEIQHTNCGCYIEAIVIE